MPIFGKHFQVYAKLFHERCLPKKCAIVADGDLRPATPDADDEDEVLETPDLAACEGDFVKVFQCKTTFERALTISGTLPMLAEAAKECGFQRASAALTDGNKRLATKRLRSADRKALLQSLRKAVLSCARRAGKARFAQICARHVKLATSLPPYIREAVEWLLPT